MFFNEIENRGVNQNGMHDTPAYPEDTEHNHVHEIHSEILGIYEFITLVLYILTACRFSIDAGGRFAISGMLIR
jgi:hypothetical protein